MDLNLSLDTAEKVVNFFHVIFNENNWAKIHVTTGCFPDLQMIQNYTRAGQLFPHFSFNF